MDYEWYIVWSIAIDSSVICWWGVVFDHWSSGRYTHGSLQSFPRERTAGVSSRSITVTNKSNSVTYTVASSLVCTSPLAVITVVAPRYPHGLQLSRVKVSLADYMQTSSGIYHKLPFFWCNRQYTFFRVRVEALPFSLRLYVFGKVPRLASGTSLLSFSLFVRSVLKFQSVGTSLMRIFDLYFSKRWAFLFPDSWRSVDCVNRTFQIDRKTFCIGFHRGCFPLWETNCGTFFTTTTALLSSRSLPLWEL